MVSNHRLIKHLHNTVHVLIQNKGVADHNHLPPPLGQNLGTHRDHVTHSIEA